MENKGSESESKETSDGTKIGIIGNHRTNEEIETGVIITRDGGKE